jgi:Arc/MetJ-type ribon-helix-helix transcriptional regulator
MSDFLRAAIRDGKAMRRARDARRAATGTGTVIICAETELDREQRANVAAWLKGEPKP